MSKPLPKALCGGTTPLRIGMLEIPCYVLQDERRVIGINGMQMAVGMRPSGGTPRLAYLAARFADNPSQAQDLTSRLDSPIQFTLPGGGIGHGYEAMLLVNLCELLLDARRRGEITPRYQRYAEAAEITLAAFAVVGIIALIDEATGYQAYRRRNALAELLDRFLSDKLNRWTKTFPDDYYIHAFRLLGLDWTKLKPGDPKPAEIGAFTREHVYRRLAPGIVRELEKCNPYILPGRRRHKHHQWPSTEIGHPALREHVGKVLTVMMLSDDMLQFNRNLTKALGRPYDQGFFDEFFAE